MSNRRRLPHPQNPLNDYLASIDGAQVPGGCEHCAAYQVVQARAYGTANFHIIRVYHDDDCPELAARTAAP